MIASLAQGGLAGLGEQTRRLTRWRAHALAAAAGAFATLAQAPFFFAPAMVVGLVALVWLLDGAKARPQPRWAAFARGWSFGAGYFVVGLHWVGFAFLEVEGGAPLIPLAVLALGGGMALFWGVAARVALVFWTDDARRVAVLALTLGLAEWLRGTLFTGFPWNLIGLIWPAGGAMSQTASVIGVYGLTALTILLLAAPATLGDAGRSFGRRIAPSLAAALCLGLLWGAGTQRLASVPVAPETWTGPVVRVVDTGFTQSEKWRPGAAERMLETFLQLSVPEESRAEIVIWPEGALPVPLLAEPPMLQAIGDALDHRVLIAGTVRLEESPQGVRAYNSAVVLDAVNRELRLGQIYDKHHLVPFGEYIPFWDLVSGMPIAPLQQIGVGFTPGRPPERLIVPGAPPAAPLICYEAIFPGYVPRGAERPEWIVNVSIDAWYGTFTGPWQHANSARYRAIEEGLPMARAASGGVSGVFDALGREMVATDLAGGAVEYSLPPSLPETFYARFDVLLTAALFFLIALLRFAAPGPARGLRS